MVCSAFAVVTTKGHRKLFQAPTKVKIETAAMAGRDSGIQMLQ